MTPPPAPDAPCPCGLGRYAPCCGRLLDAGQLAEDAHSLMRSRYTAYVLDRREHLLSTWHPTTRPAAIDPPAPGLAWLGLAVRATSAGGHDTATVEFVARSKLGGRAHRLHERSRFVREGGRWFYVDGQIDPAPPARALSNNPPHETDR